MLRHVLSSPLCISALIRVDQGASRPHGLLNPLFGVCLGGRFSFKWMWMMREYLQTEADGRHSDQISWPAQLHFFNIPKLINLRQRVKKSICSSFSLILFTIGRLKHAQGKLKFLLLGTVPCPPWCCLNSPVDLSLY